MIIDRRAQFSLMMSMTYGMMNGNQFGTYDNRFHNGVTRTYHPWDRVQLTKSERRGKTFEQLQEMRMMKYKESLSPQPPADNSETNNQES